MPNRRGGGGRGAAAAAAKKKNGAAAGGAGAGDVDKLAASGTGFDDVLDVLNADGGVAGLVKARSAGGFEVCVCVFACVAGLTALLGEGVWCVWIS